MVESEYSNSIPLIPSVCLESVPVQKVTPLLQLFFIFLGGGTLREPIFLGGGTLREPIFLGGGTLRVEVEESKVCFLGFEFSGGSPVSLSYARAILSAGLCRTLLTSESSLLINL